MKQSIISVTIVLIGLFSFAPIVLSNTPDINLTKIIIDHETGFISRTGSNNIEQRMGTIKNQSITINQNERIVISARNVNPFYFGIKINNITLSQSDGYKAVNDFIKNLNELTKISEILNSNEVEANSFKVVANGINEIMKVNLNTLSGEKMSALESIKKKINAINKTFWEELKNSIDALNSNAQKIIEYRRESLFCKNYASIKEKINNLGSQAIASEINEKFNRITSLKNEIFNNLEWLDDPAIVSKIQIITTMLVLISDEENGIKNTIAKIEQAEKVFNSLGDQVELTTLEFDITKKTEIKLEIYKIENAPETPAEASNRELGEFVLSVTPYSIFKYRFTINAIYSLIKTQNDKGISKYVGWKIFPSLTITPHIWNDNSLELGFQAGVNIFDKHLNTIFGGVISFFQDKLLFGIGLHSQWNEQTLTKHGLYGTISLQL